MTAKPVALSIAVNGRYRLHRITGVQRCAHELVSRLKLLDGPKIDVLAPKSAKGPLGHLWEQTTLAIASRGRLLWSPCGTGPVCYGRQVVTFHDLFPLEHPEWYSAAYARWYRALLPRIANASVHLIAVSEYTKSRLVKLLGRNPNDITVIPNGLTTGCTRVGADRIEAAAGALRLPSRRYVLSLSSLEKRKNLRTTLNAWAHVHSKLPRDTWLILAGPQADATVYGSQQLPADLPHVYFTGYVPEEHLAGLYSGASVFVYPSLAEGFGLPLLEALACGLRSITSDNSSLPEVGGDAVRYVDALDEVALGEAIRQELAAYDGQPYLPALERAKRFSWDHAAAQTWALLQTAHLAQHATSTFRERPDYAT
jgi:glycosyltransferase involved in cell wall biosynthesis